MARLGQREDYWSQWEEAFALSGGKILLRPNTNSGGGSGIVRSAKMCLLLTLPPQLGTG